MVCKRHSDTPHHTLTRPARAFFAAITVLLLITLPAMPAAAHAGPSTVLAQIDGGGDRSAYESSDYGWEVSWDDETWLVDDETTAQVGDGVALQHTGFPQTTIVIATIDEVDDSQLESCALTQATAGQVIHEEGADDGYAYAVYAGEGYFEYMECRGLIGAEATLLIWFIVLEYDESDTASVFEAEDTYVDAWSVFENIEGTEADGDNSPIVYFDELDGGGAGRSIVDDPEPNNEDIPEVNDPGAIDDNPYDDGLEALLPATGGPVYFWQPGELPALYQFRGDGTGTRTTYPQGSLSTGQPYGFAWYMNGDTLVTQYSSGYTDTMLITGYDAQGDVLYQEGSRQGPDPLYGCQSGAMPQILVNTLC